MITAVDPSRDQMNTALSYIRRDDVAVTEATCSCGWLRAAAIRRGVLTWYWVAMVPTEGATTWPRRVETPVCPRCEQNLTEQLEVDHPAHGTVGLHPRPVSHVEPIEDGHHG